MTTPTAPILHFVDVALMRDHTGRITVTYARTEDDTPIHRVRTNLDGQRVNVVDVGTPGEAHTVMVQSMTTALATLHEQTQADHDPLYMEVLDNTAYLAYTTWLRGKAVYERAFDVQLPDATP